MIKELLSKGLGFLAPYKLYIYLALTVAASVGVLSYGHSRYVAGEQGCIQKSAQARADYQERKRHEDAAAADKVIKEAGETASKLKDIEHDKQTSIERILTQPSNPSCVPSPIELREFNEAIRKANER